jgi:heme/copper-type cytochrome/quinol oxidase subunit 3
MAAESEHLPLGARIPAVPAGVDIPPEPPDVGARALSVASRLLCGATVFFFMAFAFAYFYLRSINADNMWHPAHVHPSKGLGTAFIVCVLLSAALSVVAGRQMKRESPSWVLAAFGGIGLGLVAVALQCIEYTRQHFGPTNGGFASVFCAWTAFYLIAVMFTMYWLETHVATELRARREPASGAQDIADADRLIAPALDAAVFYWVFLAGIGLITYVVLYLL